MRPPIVVNAKGDIQAYETIDEAQRDVEAIDVCNGEYEFYDADGRVLRATIVKPFLWERIVLEPASEPGAATEDLRHLLWDFLTRVEEPFGKAPDDSTLEELLSALLQLQKRGPAYKRKRR